MAQELIDELDDLNPNAGDGGSAAAGGETDDKGDSATADKTGTSVAGEQKPASLLDNVKAALYRDKTKDDAQARPEDEAEDAAEGAAKTGGATAKTGDVPAAPDKATKQKTWLTKTDLQTLTPKAQLRFKELITANRALTERANTAEAGFKEVEARAKDHDNLRSYLQTSRVTREDFLYGLEFVRLLKADPAKAWEHIAPVIENLQTYRGERLPEDLAADVEAGTLSAERAKELAQARNERARLKAAGEANSAEVASANAARRDEAARAEVVTALQTWENSWKSNDPDYPRKWKRVWAELRTMLDGKNPTPEEAVALAVQAKQNVEDWIKGLLPQGGEMRPVTNGGAANTNTVRQPGSYLEAARLGLSRMQREAA